jgi:type I restriction enzyme S subunit
MQYGSSAKCSTNADGVPVLRMVNLQAGVVDYTRLKYLPGDHVEFPELFLTNGDVLFNRTNSAELVGKTAVYDGKRAPCSFASYLIRLKLVGLLPEYFAYYLNSAYGRAWIIANKTQQVGHANVSGGKLKGLCIPVPPEAEQREIVRRTEESVATAAILEGDETIWSGQTNLRQSILAAAFSGKLVPQNSSDEPAAELLSRLRENKATVPEIRRTKPRNLQGATQ